MIRFLANQIRLGKISLEEIEDKFGVETKAEVESRLED